MQKDQMIDRVPAGTILPKSFDFSLNQVTNLRVALIPRIGDVPATLQVQRRRPLKENVRV
jgi:hypothetical protein